MYLSKLGFFKKKTTLANQQLLNYLNLLATNLKNNMLKKFQLAFLQQELNFLKRLTISAKAVRQKQLSIKIKYTMRKRRAKKRFILRNHRIESIELRQRTLQITPPLLPIFPEPIIMNKPPRKLKNYARMRLY